MLKKFIIERDVPGIGKTSPDGYCVIAKKSNTALDSLGNDIQWQESFVVADKTYCVYLAKDKAVIEEHAKRSGFPATTISEVMMVIDPSTAGA
jgi:hypothetical protein